MGLLEHTVCLAHTGTHTNVNLELSPVRTPYEFQKTLYTVLFIHLRYILRDMPPTKLTSSRAGFQLSEVKVPTGANRLMSSFFQHSETFWT